MDDVGLLECVGGLLDTYFCCLVYVTGILGVCVAMVFVGLEGS